MSIFICFISLLTGILLANRSYLTIIFAFIILFFGAKYKFKILKLVLTFIIVGFILAFIVNMSKKYNCLIHTLNSNIMKEFALKNNYQIDNIDILGSDLFADIVGSDYNGNQLIIDCGTATKFLIVDKNRKFYGGAISPGITMCSNMLDSNTDLLQSYNIVVPSNPYSLKTDEAVNAGAIYGTAFMAKSYIEFINKEFPNVKVTLTGGASAFLVQTMEKIGYNNFAHDPDHIIKGICRAFNIFREVYFK